VNTTHAEQLRWPDHRVKWDVVLAKEVINAGGGIVPPRLPRLWLSAVMRPFDRCRQIANHILEPDVEALCVPTRQWHGNAPVEIPRHRATLQATADVVAGEVEDTRPPMVCMLVQVAQQALGEGWQGQEPVFSLAQHRPTPIVHAARVEQVCGLKWRATVVALVPTCLRRVAPRTGSLHV